MRRIATPAIPARCRAAVEQCEYDYTIRDLTGVDIRPAKSSPSIRERGRVRHSTNRHDDTSLVKKYLESGAACVRPTSCWSRLASTFAPHPVIAETDRDKFCVNRIFSFLPKQKTDYADYLSGVDDTNIAASLGHPQAT